MTTNRAIGAGLALLHYGNLDNNGRLIGYSADGATAGNAAGEGLRRLEGAQSFPLQTPEPENFVAVGDNEPLVSFLFSAEELANGVIAMAAEDLDFEALVTNTKVRNDGTLTYVGQDTNTTGNVTLCLLVQRQAKNWYPSSRGVARWEWRLVTRAEVRPLGVNVEQRTGTPYNYFYTTSKGDSPATGQTFSVSWNGYTQTTLAKGTADNPVYFHAHQGDGTETDFTLPFGVASGTTPSVYVNGVKQVVTTDYTLTGTALSFTSAPASGARIVTVYETDSANL